MKRKALSVILLAATMLVPKTAWSQQVVHDPTNFGGIIKQIYTEIMNHADDIMMTEEQINTTISILNTTEDVTNKMDEVYRKIQPVMSKTRTLYTAANSIQSDYKMLTDAYETYAKLFSEGKITPSQFNRALRKTCSMIRVVKNDYDMISNALESVMSTKEKLDVINESTDDSKIASMEMMNDLRELQDSIKNAEILAARDSLLKNIMRTTPTRANSALDIRWNAASSKDDFEDSDTESVADTLRTSNTSLFNLVEIILGIFFFISLAWGGLLYLKGDTQHNDTLFKIALGLAFVLIVLTILKTALFKA